MPKTTSRYHDSRFVCPSNVRGIYALPGSKYIAALFNETDLALFDLESGALLDQVTVDFNGTYFCLYNNHYTGESYFLSPENKKPSHNSPHFYFRVSVSENRLLIEKTPLNFRISGYGGLQIVFTSAAVYVSDGGKLQVVDPKTSQVMKVISGSGKNTHIAICPSGQRAAIEDDSHNITVIDIESETKMATIELTQETAIRRLYLNDHTLAVAGKNSLQVWETDTLEPRGSGELHIISNFMDGRCSPGGKYFFLLSSDFALYDLLNGKPLWVSGELFDCYHFCFSTSGETLYIHDGRRILSLRSADGSLLPTSTGIGDTEISKIANVSGLGLVCDNNALDPVTGATVGKWELHDFVYNEYVSDILRNFLYRYHVDTFLGHPGSAVKVFFGSYSNMALTDGYIAICDHDSRPKKTRRLQVLHTNGKHHTNLVEGEDLPYEDILFLRDSPFLAGISKTFAALWDVRNADMVWKIDIKITSGKLFAHESGSHIFILTKTQLLSCIDVKQGKMLWEISPPKVKEKKGKFILVYGLNDRVLCLMSHSVLLSVGLDTGNVLQKDILYNDDCVAGTITGNELIAIHMDTSIARYDLSDRTGRA